MARKAKNLIKVNNSLNKKGRLKGKNKRETKILRGICPHHRINKKGNIKPATFIHDDKCNCLMCKSRFRYEPYTNEEIHDIVDPLIELNNFNKFAAIATNAGDSMNDFFANVGAELEFYVKNSKKVRNLAQKQDAVKGKRNKKNKNRYNGSSSYGSWGQRQYINITYISDNLKYDYHLYFLLMKYICFY